MRAAALLLLFDAVVAYDNGYAKKPPLGWQTWCAVGPCGTDHCFDQQIRETAKALVDNGMKDLGFEWIILDDCWHPSRDSNGTLVPYKNFFPNGMVPVIDYVHSLGLKFGLYTSVGDLTCHGGWSPGSYKHFEQDAALFASWGVDYVKADYCGHYDSAEGQTNLSQAMNKTGRPMVLELCRGPYQGQDKWGYAPGIAQLWRATGDHHDEWSSLQQQIKAVTGRGSWSKPHGWAYLDMMMVGGQGCKDQYNEKTKEWDYTTTRHCPGQTDNEYRTEVSLYAIVSSPMMVGTDIRNMTPIMNELLLNEEVYAINQDYMAPAGDKAPGCSSPAPPAPPSPAPAKCSVSLEHQTSHSDCKAGTSFGCIDGTNKMWAADGCRGTFTCNGNKGVSCDVRGGDNNTCDCQSAPATEAIYLRRLSNGNFAVAMTNVGGAKGDVSICLSDLGWPHGDSAKVRDVFKKADVGTVKGSYTATVDTHDTHLIVLSPVS